jgi:hypothetical protein
MARELPTTEPEDDDGEVIREFIQFRGRQTSVVLDEFGIRFQMMIKDTPDGEFRMHEPLPVASRDAIEAGETPANAVAEPVADELTRGDLSNPLINYGIVCEYPTGDGELCGEVYPSLKSLNGHLSSHSPDNEAADGGNEREADSHIADIDTDTGESG